MDRRARPDTELDNPLLDLSGLPRFRDIRPEHVAPAVDYMLVRNRARIQALLAGDAEPTWDGFAQPMEDLDEALERVWAPVAHLNAVCDSPALREAYDACLPRLSAYATEVSQDPRVYRAYRAIRSGPEYPRLSLAQRRLLDNTLRDLRLAGAELGEADKARFKAIRKELATLASRFDRHLLDATQAWRLHLTDPAELAGLPESARARARARAEQEGLDGWLFTLEGPSYLDFITYSARRPLRRRIYEAYVTRASDQGPHAGRWDNGPVMGRILALRREMARLLGYPHYAEYSMATKMAGSSDEVLEFLRELAGRARPAARQELAELEDYARAEDGLERLEAWDIPYYSERLREQRYRYAQEAVRAYFPEPVVLRGLFELVRRLYGVEVREAGPAQVWHPDVRLYEIRDRDGALRGRFYLDLYARRHKRGGAWMDECIGRKRTAEGVQVPVAFLTCNVSPPVGDAPALLTHDEVVTLFHEFGHGLHHMLTRVDHVGVAGINGVAWDAVELPSQFMENWCWEPEVLGFLSGHVETGAPLPGDLLDKMRSARNFQAGMQMLRQIEFALFDMLLHRDPAADGPGRIQAVLDRVREEVAVVRPPAFNRFQHGFAHIFSGGYAAGYYSYKWAEVLSADAFSRFEEEGLFNPRVGRDFLVHILEAGGTREPAELFRAFRGRPPRIDALLRHSGLAA